jgi:hypothetical protein
MGTCSKEKLLVLRSLKMGPNIGPMYARVNNMQCRENILFVNDHIIPAKATQT